MLNKNLYSAIKNIHTEMVIKIEEINQILRILSLDLNKLRYAEIAVSKVIDYLRSLSSLDSIKAILLVVTSEEDARKTIEIINSLFPGVEVFSIITKDEENTKNDKIMIIIEVEEIRSSQQNPPTLF